MEDPMQVVKEQAEDEGLWFVPRYISEDILQKALRRLHEAVEGKTSEQCARAILNLHAFSPDEDFPQFCGECGYGPNEPLKHLQPSS